MGLGVIVRLEDLMRQDVRGRVLDLVEEVGGSVEETDVLIDMGGPAYECCFPRSSTTGFALYL